MDEDLIGSRPAADADELRRAMRSLAGRLAGRIPEITAADQETGDGDHGLAIARGLAAIDARLASAEAPGIAEVFDIAGRAALAAMGGASGVIYATLLRGAGGRLHDATVLDGAAFAGGLDGALAAVMSRGGARPGDKTLVDALAPAAAAARRAAEEQPEDLGRALGAAARAAHEGAEATRTMEARMGRARTLGERALGHVDPGALSFSLFLDALRDAFAVPEG